MFRNILVPVDLTDKNRPAILSAIELAEPDKSIVRLLHVIETIQGIDFEQLDEFYRELKEKAEATLEAWEQELGSISRDIRIAVVFGRRAAEIIDFAEAEGCDLIVLTTHKIEEGRPSGGIGTISHQVALLASCPVLLLR